MLEQMTCNFTNSVQVSLIQTLKLIAFREQYIGVNGKMFWWLMKKKKLTVSWLSGLLSAGIFINTGEWGVQMPTLTDKNSQFLRSGS